MDRSARVRDPVQADPPSTEARDAHEAQNAQDPDDLDPQAFERDIRALLGERRLQDAEARVLERLRRFPEQPPLLLLAAEVCRAGARHEDALAHARRLIGVDSGNAQGYLRAAQELVALKRFEEAQATLVQGLARIPDALALQKYSAYVHAFLPGIVRLPTPGEREDYQFCMQDMVAYSCDPDYFRIVQSRRQLPGPPVASFAKQPLFVAGLPRSGTTPLGQMLAIASEVELYIELCPIYRLDGYRPTDFSADLIKARLRRHPHRELNLEHFHARHERSRFVGDKRPLFQFGLEATAANFAPVRLRTVYVHRDLPAICRSFHHRSVDPADSWPLEKGIEHAIQIYNASCRQMLHLHRHRPDLFADILFVEYGRIFTDPAAARGLFDDLGIALGEEERTRLAAFLERSSARVRRRREVDALDAAIEALIPRHLDPRAHRDFCACAGLSVSA